jgi:serine/threonine-protein kinase
MLRICPLDGTQLNSPEDPLPGRTIAGRYLIAERIGGGGMGVVYRGRHQVIDRDVAIKFLHPRLTRDPTQRKRFLGEARAANQINHEHIIDITDFGETDDGLIYLVMEYLHGHSLAQEIADRSVAPARAVRIAIQIAQGLGRAHELDVIHRDVKPANAFLVRRGDASDFVKLLDFGIARFERETRITDRGAVVGTPEYIGPEHLRYGEVGAASDLYSLGCVLFEMLTGAPPFTGSSSAVMVQQMTKPPPRPSNLVAGLPPALDEVVLKLLRKAPHERHRDAFHVVDDLAQMLHLMPSSLEPISSRPRASGQASARPTIHVPVEEDGWRQRANEYRVMAERLYPDGVPSGLSAAIQSIEQSVLEIRALRGELTTAALSLTDREDELRGLRSRVFHALDELARDESKLTRAMDVDRAELAQAELALTAAVSAVARSVSPMAEAPGPSRMLSAGAAAELGTLVHSAQELARTERARDLLASGLSRKRSELEDLRFQIAQLKGRLGSLNAASSADLSESQTRASCLDSMIRDKLDAIVGVAEHIHAQLRSHPDLATLFPEAR